MRQTGFLTLVYFNSCRFRLELENACLIIWVKPISTYVYGIFNRDRLGFTA